MRFLHTIVDMRHVQHSNDVLAVAVDVNRGEGVLIRASIDL